MANTITRMYATRADADAAVGDLAKHGFGPEEILVVGSPAAAAGDPAQVDAIVDTLTRGYILKRHAVEYAKKVAQGSTFVAVHAPFGSGLKATVLLDRHHPVDSGVPEPVYPRARYDESAPLSSALRLPVWSSDPTPFATFWNVPTLQAPGATVSAAISRIPAPLSALFGLPVLSDKAAPASSSLGLPLLSDNAAPASSLVGLPVLSNKAAPASSLVGLPVLSNKAAPASSMLGLPVLW